MDDVRAGRLFRESGAEHWGVPREALAEALSRGIAKAFPGVEPSSVDLATSARCTSPTLPWRVVLRSGSTPPGSIL